MAALSSRMLVRLYVYCGRCFHARLPQMYAPILEELLKQAPKQHADRPALQAALQAFKELVSAAHVPLLRTPFFHRCREHRSQAWHCAVHVKTVPAKVTFAS